MAVLTFIPGYLAELSIGGDAIEPGLNSGTLTRTKNVMQKPVAGSQSPSVIAGLIVDTISVSGHISTEDIAKLDAAFVSNTALAIVWGIGDTTGSPDAGEYTGSALVESFAPAWSADDEWTFSMDLVFSEGATFVAPV